MGEAAREPTASRQERLPAEDGRAGGVAVTTINRRLAAIYGFYEHLLLIDPEGIPRNPVPRGQVSRAWALAPYGLLGHIRRRVIRSALRLKVPQRLPRSLSPVEVERLIGSLRTLRDKAIALLMLYGGLRSSELLSLQMQDLDLPGGKVRVWGKGGRERVVRWTRTPCASCNATSFTSGRSRRNARSSSSPRDRIGACP